MKKNKDWLKIPNEEKLVMVEKNCQNFFWTEVRSLSSEVFRAYEKCVLAVENREFVVTF